MSVVARLPYADLSTQKIPKHRRDPTEFEQWVLARLENDVAEQGWPDQFDLPAAARFCAELGRAAISSEVPKWLALPADRDWWPPQVGHHLCFGGEVNLRNALGELQGVMGRPEDGPRKIFGGLYDLLAADPCPEDLLPFRAILRQHMTQTWPLGLGDEILGEPILQQGLCSIAAISFLLGRSEAEVLAALEDGVVPVSSASSNAWRLFNLSAACAVLDRLNLGLAEDAFRIAVSLTDAQFDQLREAGELTPRAEGCWDPLSAQRLIDAILLGAEPVYVGMHDWCSLAEAAKQLRLSSSQVIEQIHDGRLPRVGRYLLRSGFASVLVNLGHVGQPENAVSVDAFAYAQGLRPGELISFLRRSEMPFLQVRGPRGGAQVRLSAADRQVFLERFITFRTLGIATGLSWAVLLELFEAEGTTPALGSARIYDRAEIARLLP